MAGFAAVEASASAAGGTALRAFARHVTGLAALEAVAGGGTAAVTAASAAAAEGAFLAGLGAFAGHVAGFAAVEAGTGTTGGTASRTALRAFARHVAGLAALEAGLVRHWFVFSWKVFFIILI